MLEQNSLYSCIQYLVRFFFPSSVITAYGDTLDHLAIILTLVLVVYVFRFLFSPLFPRRKS